MYRCLGWILEVDEYERRETDCDERDCVLIGTDLLLDDFEKWRRGESRPVKSRSLQVEERNNTG